MDALVPHGLNQHVHIEPVPRITIDAFCQTKDVARTVATAFEHPALLRGKANTMKGDVQVAIEYYKQNNGTPSIIVIEMAQDDNGFIEALDKLAEHCSRTTNVIVIGHVNSVSLHRTLLDRGVEDYLVVEEFDPVDLVRAISKIYDGEATEVHGHVTAVLGAVGGAGTSTVACNIASNMAGLVPSAVLVDLDFAGGTAAFSFEKEAKQDISEALFIPERIDLNLLQRLLITCDHNLAILPAPATLDKTWDVAEDAVSKIIATLRSDNSHLVLDLPRTWTQWVSLSVQMSHEVIVVMTPTFQSLRNAQEIQTALERLGKSPKFVLNQVGAAPATDVPLPNIINGLNGAEPIIQLAHDPVLFGEAAANARMLSQVQPKGPAATALNDLARQLAGVAPTESFPTASLQSAGQRAGIGRLLTKLPFLRRS